MLMRLKNGFSLGVIATVAATGLLVGCGHKDDQQNTVSLAENNAGVILARVNGEAINERDLDFIIEKTFSQADQLQLNNEVRQKVLASLVVSKAMKQAALKELDGDQLDAIQQRVRAYEEELFVQAFLQAKAMPAPVTSAMIETYYQNNLDQFGAVELKSFEMLSAADVLTNAQRDKLLANVDSIKAMPQWSNASIASYGLVLQKGEATPGLLDDKLQQLLAPLSVGETSSVSFIDGRPYLMRVTAVRTLAAKPLSEVSGDIRKRLAPQQLRTAVKAVSDEILANTQVEYLSQ